MFQEPIRLIEDAIRNNRSVLDLIYGNYTFVIRVAGQALRNARRVGRRRTIGCGSTMRELITAAAACCPWRSSSPRTRRACAPAR